MSTVQSSRTDSVFTRSGKLLYQKYREFFLPTILASMSSSMAIIVDSVIVGNMLGPKEMASVNLCIPVMQFFFTFAILIGMGSSTLIATAMGRGDTKEASASFTTSLVVATIVGLFFTVFTAPFSMDIASILTSDTELIPFVNDYLFVIVLGCVFIIIIPIFAYSIRTDGMAKLSSSILIVANVTNLVLDLVFIGPCGLGIAGSALATICGYIVGTVVVVWYWKSKRRTLALDFSLIANIGKLFSKTVQIFKIGCPGAISSTLIVIKIFCVNLIVGSIAGSDGLIVFSVCFSALSFLSMFISGTAGAMMPLVGVLFGQKDFKGVRLIFGYTLKIALALTVGIIVVFEFFPSEMFALFGVKSIELLEIGIPSIRLYSVSLIGVTITFIMIYYYMSILKHNIANLLSISEGLIFVVPLAWLFSMVWGINGIWMGFIVAEVVTMAILFFGTRIEIKRSEGRYDDALLIEHYEPGVLYDVSLSGSKENAVKISFDAINVLKRSGLNKAHALQIGIAIEEMVAHAQMNNNRVNIDVMITSHAQNTVISVRDNGAWFNPLEYSESDNKELSDGITLLKQLASEIKYNRVLNLNQTLIVISKDC